jgi:hypothetical protein
LVEERIIMISNRQELYAANGSLISITDSRNIEDVRSAITVLINTRRDYILSNMPMWFIGHPWQTDAAARSNVNGAITTVLVGVPLPPTFTWRDLNNVDVPMNATILITFGALMAQWTNTVYAYSWAFKAEIDGLATLGELDTIVVENLPWPDGNMDGTKPVSFTPSTVSDGSTGTAYTQTFTVSGGKPPYTMTVNSGTLPSGVSLANTTLSGTPTASGTYTFELLATDNSANTVTNAVALTGSQTYTMNIT